MNGPVVRFLFVVVTMCDFFPTFSLSPICVDVSISCGCGHFAYFCSLHTTHSKNIPLGLEKVTHGLRDQTARFPIANPSTLKDRLLTQRAG